MMLELSQLATTEWTEMHVCGIVGPFEDYVKEELLRVARGVAKHYMSVIDNESVYEITYVKIGDTAVPDEWRYLGNEADARYGQCLGRAGYVRIDTARIDLIIEIIKGGEHARVA